MIIRWVCEKDNKKWLYPIEKCIYCKEQVTKQISTKAKVMGITKVNIPSPMHPIIPYYVMLLEDEYGNRMPKKTMKECNIGDEYEIKQATQDGAVILTKIKYDIFEYMKWSLKLLHNYDLSAEDKVLIKPSIIEPAYPYQAVNTNPRLLDALITYLKERGINDIIVAEQAMLGNDTMASAKKAGILDVCKKHEIPFVDLSKSEFVEKNVDGFDFRIAKELFERKVINVPVMKTNSQLTISGAIENLVRVVDEKTQKNMFEGDIEKTLPKLIKALPGFLSIGDVTIGLQGQGPTSLGEPLFLNMLFISKDPVALDSVFVETGVLPMPDYIKEAGAIGAGNSDVKDIQIIGDELGAIKCPFKEAKNNVTAHSNIKIIDGKANPYIFNTALKLSAKLVGLLGSDINIVIGSRITKEMLQGKERLVVYGDDAIKLVKEFGVNVVAEIPEDIDDMEKVVLLKSILQNPDKKRITGVDKIKSKIVSFGAKIKRGFN